LNLLKISDRPAQVPKPFPKYTYNNTYCICVIWQMNFLSNNVSSKKVDKMLHNRDNVQPLSYFWKCEIRFYLRKVLKHNFLFSRQTFCLFVYSVFVCLCKFVVMIRNNANNEKQQLIPLMNSRLLQMSLYN
jgi:hypothetical protein